MVVITCLSNVATQVGVGRILGGSKFHYPVGQPELPPEEELRWRVERDYQELKQEIGLDHFEGRSLKGFHHHAALCAVGVTTRTQHHGRAGGRLQAAVACLR